MTDRSLLRNPMYHENRDYKALSRGTSGCAGILRCRRSAACLPSVVPASNQGAKGAAADAEPGAPQEEHLALVNCLDSKICKIMTL